MKYEPELDIDSAVSSLSKAVDPETGIVNSLSRVDWPNDEPPVTIYSASLSNTAILSGLPKRADKFHTGIDLNEKIAILKAFGEAVERYSSSFYSRESLKYASYSELEGRAIEPKKFIKFSKSQLEGFEEVRFSKEDNFWWVSGKNIQDLEETQVPAQIVYLPYVRKEEPFLRGRISTGLASGTSTEAAIFRGVCEVIERDSFILSYLNKLSIEEVDKKSIEDPEIGDLIERVESKNLELRIFKLPTDSPLEVFTSATIDRTGEGPAIVFGANAHFNTKEAILDSIYESLHSRPWLREKKSGADSAKIEEIRENYKKVTGIKERGLFWYDESILGHLDFWLENTETSDLEMVEKTRKESWKELHSFFESKDFTPVYVNLTTEDVREIDFSVVRVVIPEMHPLYLNEKFKYLGGERLYKFPVELRLQERQNEEKDLTVVPQPFL